ncbi:hypothetical protein [Wenzhouxiangella sp. XN24]|uniref:hypothetical protein n=1 Tax=Wenzhouxiangella sp. XN24 TaxID=2713569 RepID=UPI0013EB16BB|nr:hypothetical protein [Wenzhouxiangella sp. XN24]NGX16168.1 hypothetical protein [Wenzhouxiangella sp. XN24]
MLILAASGCSRVDTLRFAYANEGTPAEWPAGAAVAHLALEPTPGARPWLPVSIDDSDPVPFLFQASAGAIGLTGARAAGFGPIGAGRLTLRGPLLPGVRGGMLIKQRHLALGGVALRDQSLLLVDPSDWPHGQPGGGAAGVIGYDLLRRFVVELDLGAGRVSLHRRNSFDVGGMPAVSRLAVLRRVPYFEAWVEFEQGEGRWVRLQFEPASGGGLCLDEPLPPAVASVGGLLIPVEPVPCEPPAAAADEPGGADPGAARDGLFGAQALRDLVVAVDYENGRIGFRPTE